MRKTVFIVGAGASTDYGLPLGSRLVHDIREELTRNIANPHQDGLLRTAMEANLSGDYSAAAMDVAGGMVSARSIDRFLDSRQDRELTVHVGKCAIAYCLLNSESRSPLGSMRNEEWLSIQQALVDCDRSWLSSTFALLHEGIRPSAANSIFSRVSFVTFNYDRCIERYLRLAFRQIMNLSELAADEIADHIPVVHIYGSLGELASSNNNLGIPFGASTDRTLEAALSLRTFTEGAAEGTLERAQALIRDAEQIIFLGFAFDPVNVAALFPQTLQHIPDIFATCHGVADPERRSFQNAIGDVSIDWDNSYCKDFCQTLKFRTICQ